MKETPKWLEQAMEGNFNAMDEWLAKRGYDPLVLAELPFPAEIEEDATVLLNEMLPELRAVQKTDRKSVV